MTLTVADIFGVETVTPEFYKIALTHSSYTIDLNLSHTECYERLEFLGDAVLKLAISDVLYRKYPDYPEGELSKIRSIVISDNTLADIVKKNGLQELIILSKHEEKAGCRKLNSVCACVFEALLGAYYLDGKLNDIISYVETTFEPYIVDVEQHFEKFNAKAILQEYTQGKTKTRPVYTVVSQSGPAHKKIFEVQVSYDDDVLATATGTTKKEAEQKCAYAACEKLGII